MAYKNEAAFSHAFCSALGDKGIVQRIESGETGRGIPDIFYADKNVQIWVELKNQQFCSITDSRWNVHWRRGQQVWAMKYRAATGICSYTVVAVRDGFIVIPMLKHFVKNVVLLNNVICYKSIHLVVAYLRKEDSI